MLSMGCIFVFIGLVFLPLHGLDVSAATIPPLLRRRHPRHAPWVATSRWLHHFVYILVKGGVVDLFSPPPPPSTAAEELVWCVEVKGGGS